MYLPVLIFIPYVITFLRMYPIDHVYHILYIYIRPPLQSGNYLLSSSTDSSLRIWDLREGRLLYTLQGMLYSESTICMFMYDCM